MARTFFYQASEPFNTLQFIERNGDNLYAAKRESYCKMDKKSTFIFGHSFNTTLSLRRFPSRPSRFFSDLTSLGLRQLSGPGNSALKSPQPPQCNSGWILDDRSGVWRDSIQDATGNLLVILGQPVLF